MQVFCSNCNTPHEVTQEQAESRERSIIHCRNCDKKIKLQFCPHCGSFYSITFSNIKSGRYRYKCRKCLKDFAIEFTDKSTAGETPEPAVSQKKDESSPVSPEQILKNLKKETAPAEKIEVANFINNSINSFSINELFAAAAGAFTFKKMAASSIGVTFMLLLMWIFSQAEALWFGNGRLTTQFAGSLLSLAPVAIIFSLYTATAAVVSRITLDMLFQGAQTEWDDLIRFSLKTGIAVFTGNILLLLAVSSLLILFGRIPLLGPVFFSLAFLPVYVMSIMIFLLCFIGVWFYPPLSAHRERGLLGNMKNLLLFIKKHNLGLLYMIPVIILVTVITVSVIFIIHTSAFSLSISLSRNIISGDGGGVFASIPASFVKASEATVTGLGSGLFRQLSINTGMTHTIGGFILGATMILLTVLLLSAAVSVTATVSSHIYIVMERGLTIDDRKKGAVFLILTLMLSVLLLLKKLF